MPHVLYRWHCGGQQNKSLPVSRDQRLSRRSPYQGAGGRTPRLWASEVHEYPLASKTIPVGMIEAGTSFFPSPNIKCSKIILVSRTLAIRSPRSLPPTSRFKFPGIAYRSLLVSFLTQPPQSWTTHETQWVTGTSHHPPTCIPAYDWALLFRTILDWSGIGTWPFWVTPVTYCPMRITFMS